MTIDGRHTAVSVEDQFWDQLRHIAIDRHMTVSNLICEIDAARKNRKQNNLSSAIRMFVLEEIKKRAQNR